MSQIFGEGLLYLNSSIISRANLQSQQPSARAIPSSLDPLSPSPSSSPFLSPLSLTSPSNNSRSLTHFPCYLTFSLCCPNDMEYNDIGEIVLNERVVSWQKVAPGSGADTGRQVMQKGPETKVRDSKKITKVVVPSLFARGVNGLDRGDSMESIVADFGDYWWKNEKSMNSLSTASSANYMHVNFSHRPHRISLSQKNCNILY